MSIMHSYKEKIGKEFSEEKNWRLEEELAGKVLKASQNVVTFLRGKKYSIFFLIIHSIQISNDLYKT